MHFTTSATGPQESKPTLRQVSPKRVLGKVPIRSGEGGSGGGVGGGVVALARCVVSTVLDNVAMGRARGRKRWKSETDEDEVRKSLWRWWRRRWRRKGEEEEGREGLERNKASCEVFLGSIVVILHNLTIVTSTLTQLLVFTNRYLSLVYLLYLSWIFLIDLRTPFQGGTYRGSFHRTLPHWRWLSSYFRATLIRDTPCPFPDTQNYLFIASPHGFFCTGPFLTFATNATDFSRLFPGIYPRLSTLSFNFYVPVLREVNLWYGSISVGFESCLNWLVPERTPWLSAGKVRCAGGDEKAGRGLVIIVGGAEESLLMRPGTLDVVLRKRKGFVRLALTAGASLVPVLTFGENDMYRQVHASPGSLQSRLQTWVRKNLGFSVPIVCGRFLWLLPFRTRLVTVVGAPIPITQRHTSPSPDLVSEYHERYIKALKHLYEKYKDVYHTDRTRELAIVA